MMEIGLLWIFRAAVMYLALKLNKIVCVTDALGIGLICRRNNVIRSFFKRNFMLLGHS